MFHGVGFYNKKNNIEHFYSRPVREKRQRKDKERKGEKYRETLTVKIRHKNANIQKDNLHIKKEMLREEVMCTYLLT